MIDLPPFRYGAILADPPWSYENWSEAGSHKNASSHYNCMSFQDLASLNVGHLAAPDCALFMWVTDPLLIEGVQLMRAWGFTYKTVAFTWAKRTPRDTGWHVGLGYWTRANPEMCLLGTIGKPKRLNRDVRQLIVAPVREHSRKPADTHVRIERLVAGPYCELFARERREGWDSWGNQTDKFNEAAA